MTDKEQGRKVEDRTVPGLGNIQFKVYAPPVSAEDRFISALLGTIAGIALWSAFRRIVRR